MIKRIMVVLAIINVTLCADWTQSLSNLQQNETVKQSYLSGMLTGQTYGNYQIETLHSQKLINALYTAQENSLFWFDESGQVNSMILSMVDFLKHTPNEGLNPERYHLSEAEFLRKQLESDVFLNGRDRNLALVKLDILLSDAFFTVAQDLTISLIDYFNFRNILYAKSQKEEVNYRWDSEVESIDYLALLKQFKENGSIANGLYGLIPSNTIYNNLKEAYHRYLTIVQMGGFQHVSKVGTLKRGAVSDRVIELSRRLNQSGDLLYFDETNKMMNDEVVEALKKYQKRVGIWPSGVLNSTTVNALNISAKERLDLIHLNLERARWEKESFQFRHIFVNIPEFLMRFLEGSAPMLSARVIVGKPQNPTPIFESKMSYVVLNPRWSVPNSIVAKEMLEKIQEDPFYLEDRNYKLYNGWSKNREEIDTFDVDWYKYDEKSHIPFNIVQEPGKHNPLGNVKFMFPNNHAVYMHDTPSKHLFKKSVRAFSHGCIRLQDPDRLLEFVSNDYLNQPYQAIASKLKTGENHSMSLNEKIPVYIRYYTAYVDDTGNVIFGRDIYGYDKIQQKLLQKNL